MTDLATPTETDTTVRVDRVELFDAAEYQNVTMPPEINRVRRIFKVGG